jgi:magnesium transporter
MIVTCTVYENGVRRQEPLAVEDALEAGAIAGAFVWIVLHSPTQEEFDAVSTELELPPLAIEDAVAAHQRPKLEIYGETCFLVAKTANYDESTEVITFEEVHMFAGRGFLVTVHHGIENQPEHLLHEAEHLAEISAFGPGGAMYAMLDHTVDSYLDVIDAIDSDIDELEAQVFSETRSNAAERIFKLKRQVLAFQRAVSPLEEISDRLAKQNIPAALRHNELSNYFRDVHDHTLRVSGRIEMARDTLSSALEANLAQISVRQNDDMRAMAGWAAVIAVPTLFAGIWGMNFVHMPELGTRFGYPIALATIVGSAAFVWRRLKRNGWI